MSEECKKNWSPDKTETWKKGVDYNKIFCAKF